jgi:hypothetical protein
VTARENYYMASIHWGAAESQIGEGSTFTFTIPVRRAK